MKYLRKVLEKYDGELTYEAAKELEYVEKVVSETLRRYPVAPSIQRVCTKDYTIPGTDIEIEKELKAKQYADDTTLLDHHCKTIQLHPALENSTYDSLIT